MLVNDLIRGLYPEAVAIGEDVSAHNVSVFSCCKYLCSAINLVGVFIPLRDWLVFFILWKELHIIVLGLQITL